MERWIARVTIGAATFLAGSIVLTLGFGFLCYALYLGLLTMTSPAVAALATGGAVLILAVVIVLIGRLISAGSRARPRSEDSDKGGTGAETNKLATDIGDLVGRELISLVRANPGRTAIASLLSGFAIGAFPELRHAIRDLLIKNKGK